MATIEQATSDDGSRALGEAAALGAALRALEEAAAAAQWRAEQAQDGRYFGDAEAHRRQASQAEAAARTIERLLRATEDPGSRRSG